jgi:hypothetical protein
MNTTFWSKSYVFFDRESVSKYLILWFILNQIIPIVPWSSAIIFPQRPARSLFREHQSKQWVKNNAHKYTQPLLDCGKVHVCPN